MNPEDHEPETSVCDCGIPILENDEKCQRCGKVVSAQRLSLLIGKTKKIQESKFVFNCSNCGCVIMSQQSFCSNCGLQLNATQFPRETSQIVECNVCRSELTQNQKFCSGCGIEIVWQELMNPQIGIPVPRNHVSKSPNKSLMIIAFAVGIILLFLLFSLGRLTTTFNPNSVGKSPQEECFEREMSKMGAFINRKDWAIKSRIYCQSLYP